MQQGDKAPHSAVPNRLKAGKLPVGLLERLLAGIRTSPRVLIGGGIGRDAAVIEFSEETERLLVAKTDPITFATDRIGWYAVNINANDIACMGADPVWFLATVLLPENCEEALAAAIFSQIQQACDELEVALVGGHTEVTVGIDRPLIAGCMLGEVPRSRLIRPESAVIGDLLVLTQGIAIEGTAVLAREAPLELRAAGVDPGTVESARRMLDDPGVSVVQAARVLRDIDAVHALHDPTEGGLATAICELATAAGLGLRLSSENIPVFPETAGICQALGLDPLGLLASGSLLAAVDPSGIEAVTEELDAFGIPNSVIGELISPDEGFISTSLAGDEPLKMFERDELARYLEN
jgi:hydrogenase maturation factor